MPSVTLPPELWSRIFFFVAPPLPFVGMEDESFVADAKAWRGDEDVKGRWGDIDNLMLVSKHINALVSPFFWSYVVLQTGMKAMELWFCLEFRSEQTRKAIYAHIKVIRTSDKATQPYIWADDLSKHPVLAIVGRASRLVHLHLPIVYRGGCEQTHPYLLECLRARRKSCVHLQGLSGLVLGETDPAAAAFTMSTLRLLAPSLRRLSVFTCDDLPPSTDPEVSSWSPTDFPHLVYLATGSFDCGHVPWLEEAVSRHWHVPALVKLAIGPPPGNSRLPEDEATRLYRASDARPLNALYLTDLPDVGNQFGDLAATGAPELAFGLQADEDMSREFFTAQLDLAPDGQSSAIKVVVIVEQDSLRSSDDGYDRCLVELVNKRRLPSLEKVVWVPWSMEEHDECMWSSTLVRWLLALSKSGVEFEIE